MRAASDTAPSVTAGSVDELEYGDRTEKYPETKITFRNYCAGICPKDEGPYPTNGRRDPPEKGRPPPGGEEAEVVVYQPRGVGLMHTRHKPSNTHYTHASAEGRKCCLLIESTM